MAGLESSQWLGGKRTIFAIIPFCARPGSSGWLCLVDPAVILLPWEISAASQAVLMGLLPQSPPYIADPNTAFSCG